jgi:hypothetical protein
MPASTQNPKYLLYYRTWQQTRDAVCGSVAIKNKGARYLPVPDGETGVEGALNRSNTRFASEDNRGTATLRYRNYIKRAVYTNFTGRTKNALIGAVFRKGPTIVLPEAINYLISDATGDGLSLTQLAKDELSNILEVGRAGFLVDYPQAGSGLTEEEVAMLDLRASIVPYTAEQIINWKADIINGRKLLNLVVLEEDYPHDDDEFGHETKKQQRVLRLTPEGYSQQLYREEEPFTEEFYPAKADGTRWMEIPFIFCGSKNNDASIDDAPMADIAEVNLAHYRNSADYEESCFLTGQPTLFITHSLSDEEWQRFNPTGIKLGSRAGHVLGATGNATLVQAQANTIVREAMNSKVQEMISIGARIVTDRGQNETAEGARIRFASENSVLGDLVHNLSEALYKSIEWVAEFMGVTGEIEFYLNDEFYDKSVDPQLIMSMVTLLDREIIGEEDIFERLKSAGLVEPERTLEMVRSERGLNNPLI